MLKHFIWNDDELMEMLDHLTNEHWFYIFDVAEITTLRVEESQIKLFQIYYGDPDEEDDED
jgi:hypothetical protein